MADNVTVNLGSGGASVAADDISSVHYQRIKLIHGANGVNDGDVATGNPLPVVQTGTLNVGTVTAVTAISNALPAGTNNIGDVDILTIAAGDNNIGNVDIVTMPNVTLAAGTNTNEVVGDVAHDTPVGGNPLLMAGYASAAAPSDVSGDGDAVRAWMLRNGATSVVLTAAGALIPGDATNGLDVDVTRLPALVAGSANIGDVDVASIAAGDNNIGNVDIVSLPALAAGTNNIGDVDVLTVPADPFGVNADAASATGSVSAKLRGIATALGVTALDLGSGTGGSRTLRIFPDTAATIGLSAGTAGIGKLTANSGVDIGDVDVTTCGTITPGTAAANLGKAEDAQHASGDVGVMALAVRQDTPANSGADADYEPLKVSNGSLWTSPLGFQTTCTTDVVLPTSSVYAANDAISDSTSGPTAGGFTFTSAARKSGGSGIITDAIIVTSVDAGTLLQGEIWLFDQAVTAINDNAAFAVSDAEMKFYVGKIPFTLEDAGSNGTFHATNLCIGFTCVGTANLRFLIKAKNAYTPATDTLTFRIKCIQTN